MQSIDLLFNGIDLLFYSVKMQSINSMFNAIDRFSVEMLMHWTPVIRI